MRYSSSFWWAVGLLSLAACRAGAVPVISEFMAANKATLTDEDGAFSDWIEIHNPDATAVNLAGWRLTDSLANPGKWVFPAVTLEPGGFLTVFSSNKNRINPAAQLHTNFALGAGGEYLALSAPDGIVAAEFAPAFPAQEDDVSFGLSFSSTSLIPVNHPVRYLIPNSGTSTAWKDRVFADGSWTQGTTGLGFGLLVPGMLVKEVQTNITMESLAKLDAALAGTPSPPALSADTRIRQVINFLGDGGDGRFAVGNVPFSLPGDTHGLRATGFINIPTSGAWTFGINSDDGSRLRVDLNGDGDFLDAGENVIVDDTGHGARDTLATVASMAAGSYRIEVAYFENAGGDEMEFFAQSGTHTIWNSGFKLVGDTANGGLTVVTPADGSSAGSGSVISTNIQTAMLGVRSSCFARISFNLANAAAIDNLQLLDLKMRYNDGFVAYFNGVEIARRNAPATPVWNSTATTSRSAAESLVVEPINLTAARSALVTGANILAVHGLNITSSDASFLILPEVNGGRLQPGGPFYFKQSTPGSLNSTPASLGFVADTSFSQKRGILTAPFSLNISTTTPGASIRYTLDGSVPSETTGTLVLPANAATPPVATLNVSSTTVVRAMAFKANFDSTNVDTNTYLFPDDIVLQQPAGTPPAGWPVGPVNGQVLDYGMDPDIVNSANPALGGVAQVKASLLALPSVCVSLPVGSLMDPATGIFTHAGEDGYAWERGASIEMLNDPSHVEGGFQENAGLRIRGGFSRSADNPKHAFRVLFRGEYGAGKLNYPLFPGDPTAAQEFDKFDLQTAQNYSWSFQNDGSNTFLRELWSRDTQLAMGHPATRGRFIHLFLNGIYWGLYQIQERAEANYAASYLGGTPEDYDVVKVETTAGYSINPTDGDLNAWTDLWTKARANYFINTNRSPVSPYPAATYTQAQKDAAFFRMMGLAPDGLTPTADPVLLDADNLIDYMLTIFLSGNSDAPINGGGTFPNNFYSMRDRRGGKGFLHFQHDGEHSLNAGGAGFDRTGPFSEPLTGPWSQLPKSNPQYIHQDLTPNAEYRMRFADRVHKYMISPDGILHPTKNQARMSARAAVVETAIRAESARWGDAKNAVPYTADHWRTAVNNTLNWFTNRNAAVLPQLIADGLYPPLGAPVMSPSGGALASNITVTMTAPSATIYYTLNGADPRLPGGALHPAAQTYSGGVISQINMVAAGPSGSLWRYLANGSNQGTAWRDRLFVDTSWSGPAAGEFGYGEGDENTILSFGPDANNKYITSYFRTSFELASVAGLTNLTFEAKRDDGIVVYLNGTEIVRSNLPAGNITNNSIASLAGDDGQIFVSFPNLPLDLLRTGNNVLAVELRQNGATSSDLTFDGRLFASSSNGAGTQLTLPPGLATIRARVQDGSGTWSALNEQQYLINTAVASSQNLTVSELMYHPADPSPAEQAAGFLDPQSFQWIELLNTSAQPIDLRGASFSMGITFTFPDQLDATTVVPAGGRILLVENLAAFQFRYGHTLDGSIAGQFNGALANGGERLVLNADGGTVIMDFTYDDAIPWPAEADGLGRSLVLDRPGTVQNPNQPISWRASAVMGGSPASTDATNFDTWKLGFPGITNHSDEDSDGLDSLLEYAHGSNPNVPSTEALPQPAIAPHAVGNPPVTSNYLTLTWQRNLAAGDLTYVVEQSDSLAALTWQPVPVTLVSNITPGSGSLGMTTVRLNTPFPGTTARTFLRLRVTRN